MKLKPVFRGNWLTRHPSSAALPFTLGLVVLLLGGYLSQYAVDLSASGLAVFQKDEAWRAWSALFNHADIGHLLSNLVLFVPFAYALSGYFSPFFFPLGGFLAGGLINLIVLKTLPPATRLLGVSGVVYWMGAAWITLSFLIDRRESKSKRTLKAIGVSALLFLPQVYRPEVSYLSHLLGYVAGVLGALTYYAFARTRFHSAERFDYVWDIDSLWDPERNAFSEDLLRESFALERSEHES